MEEGDSAVDAFAYACKAVSESYEDIPDGRELEQKIVDKLRQFFDQPPLETAEVLAGKRFTIDELQIALFKPRNDQIRYFPLFFHSLDTESKNPNHILLKSMSLTLIYIVHRRNWSFLEQLILSDGLHQLASLIDTENLYYRGQVIEIFLSVTDCDCYDWFKADDGYVTRNLHQKLRELSDHPTFIKALISHREHSYPGGSFRCLQLLAFWLSWVRALYTSDRRLHLGKEILDALQLWSKGVGDNIVEDEMTLASTLYDDFAVKQYDLDGCDDQRRNSGASLITGIKSEMISQESLNSDKSVAPQSNEAAVTSKVFVSEMVEELSDESSDVPADINANLNNSTDSNDFAFRVEDIRSLKNKGNDLYQLGNLNDAMQTYDRCLDLISSLSLTNDASEHLQLLSLEASLNYNKATIYWKRAFDAAKIGPTKTDSCDDKQHSSSDDDGDEIGDCVFVDDASGVFELLQCQHACERAIQLNPSYMKAVYRLSNVFYKLRKLDEALDVLEEFINEMKTSNKLAFESDDQLSNYTIDGMKTIHAFKRKCLAAKMLSRSSSVVQDSVVNEYDKSSTKPRIGSQTMRVLEALKKRNDREKTNVSHPWNGWTPPIEEDIPSGNGIGGSFQNQSISPVDNIFADMVRDNEMKTTKSAKSLKTVRLVPKLSDNKTKKSETLKTKKALDYIIQLKKTAVEFEKHGTASSFEVCRQLIFQIWDAGQSLLDVVSISLEEPLLQLLLLTIHEFISSNRYFSIKCFRELQTVERFGTILQMTLAGNDSLKEKYDAILNDQ